MKIFPAIDIKDKKCVRLIKGDFKNKIDDELKAIYHSKDTVCFYIFKSRDLRNNFIERTKRMKKIERENYYKKIYGS